MGKPVKEVTYRVSGGQQVILHETSYGPIPEQTEHFRFPLAGPFFEKADGDKPGRFHMGYTIEFLDDSKPARMVIEDVTGETAQLLVDDMSPRLASGKLPAWNGDAHECAIRPDNPCSSWLYAKGTQRFILRATATLADGTTDVLYQAIQFEPEHLLPILKDMGAAP
jgi:hypothetical protein